MKWKKNVIKITTKVNLENLKIQVKNNLMTQKDPDIAYQLLDIESSSDKSSSGEHSDELVFDASREKKVVRKKRKVRMRSQRRMDLMENYPVSKLHFTVNQSLIKTKKIPINHTTFSPFSIHQ